MANPFPTKPEPAKETLARPRYQPARALPEKHHVAGAGPHDPPAATVSAADERAREPDEFLYAVDLFNHGYYWEAHEAWEGLWKTHGRLGPQARFYQGLIKLAAAAVKAREGRPIGVRRHCQRATELFLAARRSRADQVDRHTLAWDALLAAVDQLATRSESFRAPDRALLLDIVLVPSDVG